MKCFRGPLQQRLDEAGKLIDEAAGEAEKRYPGAGLDLLVLPEYAITSGQEGQAKEQAVKLDGVVRETLSAQARQHHTYLIVPMVMDEGKHFSNAAVLYDRGGEVAGIYRKVYPMAGKDNCIEGGILPGAEFPVFTCDFGKLGMLICWDMAYDEGWEALAQKGAELVALCSASPQTVRPAGQALRRHYYVLTSTPRNNASLFNPLGIAEAQTTAGSVLVRQIDLSYAIIHWCEGLDNGQSFTRKFTDRAGYRYSECEDTGIFWSNDPKVSIGSMMRELGFNEMNVEIERVRNIDDAARGGVAT